MINEVRAADSYSAVIKMSSQPDEYVEYLFDRCSEFDANMFAKIKKIVWWIFRAYFVAFYGGDSIRNNLFAINLFS